MAKFRILETNYEQMIVNFPNLLHSDLRRMPKGKFGEINVYLRQGVNGAGRIDLAFVTETVVHLIELKRADVDEGTLEQWRSYYYSMKDYYPNHEFRGYLIGEKCPTFSTLKELIGDDPIEIMLYSREIPHWSEVRGCPRCGLGLADDLPCPVCRDLELNAG